MDPSQNTSNEKADRPRQEVGYMLTTRPTASINAMACTIHEQWRKERDRSYSPFNKPWSALTAEERQQSSRRTRDVVDALRAEGVDVPFIDEYAQPGPGDVRWTDPIRQS